MQKDVYRNMQNKYIYCYIYACIYVNRSLAQDFALVLGGLLPYKL